MVIIEIVAADFDFVTASRNRGASGVGAVNEAIFVIINAVGAVFYRGCNTCWVVCADGILAIDQAIVVVIDIVVADFIDGVAFAVRGGPASGVSAVGEAIFVIIKAIVADFCAGSLGCGSLACCNRSTIGILTVDEAIARVIDTIVANFCDGIGTFTVVNCAICIACDVTGGIGGNPTVAGDFIKEEERAIAIFIFFEHAIAARGGWCGVRIRIGINWGKFA